MSFEMPGMINNPASSQEQLNQDEQKVYDLQMRLNAALAEYDKAAPNLIARGEQGMNGLSEIYGEKWKTLHQEFEQAYGKLGPDSQKRVMDKIQSESAPGNPLGGSLGK
jgi:hypothetical protein